MIDFIQIMYLKSYNQSNLIENEANESLDKE